MIFANMALVVYFVVDGFSGFVALVASVYLRSRRVGHNEEWRDSGIELFYCPVDGTSDGFVAMPVDGIASAKRTPSHCVCVEANVDNADAVGVDFFQFGYVFVAIGIVAFPKMKHGERVVAHVDEFQRVFSVAQRE